MKRIFLGAILLAGGSPDAAHAAPSRSAPELALPSNDAPQLSIEPEARDAGASYAALQASTGTWTRTLTEALDSAARSAPAASTLSVGQATAVSQPVRLLAFTSRFGLRFHPIFKELRYHDGVDIAARHGSPILATSDGVVGAAGWRGGYGLCVEVRHGGALVTRYGHMSRMIVAPGEAVRKGQVIGFVGSTGFSTGPHLHFEVRIGGRPVDPMPYLVSATPFGRS